MGSSDATQQLEVLAVAVEVAVVVVARIQPTRASMCRLVPLGANHQ